MAEIGKDIEKARQLLEKGELVVIPTETVYGLAANALNESAVLKVFEVKSRPAFDPLIVHVGGIDSIAQYAEEFPPGAKHLAERFWPGPLTLVLRKKPVINDLVTAGLPTVGLRCPDHPLSLQLLKATGFPLAAPSANPFGYVSPTKVSHVVDQLDDSVSYILDGGDCSVGVESTIVGWNDHPVIHRPGGLPTEMIESIVGRTTTVGSFNRIETPGQLKSHYAPRKRIILGSIRELLERYPDRNKVAVLSFSADYNVPNQVILSPSGDVRQAARNLFASLREADNMNVEVILTEHVPDRGLGRAINDRLSRASAK